MRFQKRSQLFLFLFTAILVSSCAGADCPVTEPVWAQPPADPAVSGTPGYGYYFVNEDRSIWAAAWWEGQDENYIIPGEGIKTGWFKPEGANLEITAQRLDGDAPVFEAYVPCCYPTRFQATGLYFPAAGCWEVTSTAGDSTLTFVVKVDP